MKSISDHNFGDSEIRNIRFSLKKAMLTFFCPHDFLFAKVTLSDVKILSFSTNHTQNVVDGVYFIDNEMLENNSFIIESLEKMSYDLSKTNGEICGIYVSGIAGPELVAVCDHVSVEVEPAP